MDQTLLPAMLRLAEMASLQQLYASEDDENNFFLFFSVFQEYLCRDADRDSLRAAVLCCHGNYEPYTNTLS